MLSNTNIRDLLQKHPDLIFPIRPKQIQPCSVDVRLGTKYRTPLHPMKGVSEEFSAQFFILRPHEFILAQTLEHVKVPNTHAMKIDGRSSIGRLGLLVHATAGLIDPGFEGDITLELYNLTNQPRRLQAGMTLAQLEIHRLDSPADPPYGKDTGAHYQGQKGATPSYLEGTI